MAENKSKKTSSETIFKKIPLFKRSWQKRIRELSENENIWTVVTFIVLIFLLGPEIQRAPYNYKLGEIAKTTIRVPFDITVEDISGIEERRKSVVESVLPVFDYSPLILEQERDLLVRYFDKGRAILVSFAEEKKLKNVSELTSKVRRSRTLRRQLLERLRSGLQIKTSDKILSNHVSQEFGRKLQENVFTLHSRVRGYLIVESREKFKDLAQGGFVKRTITEEGSATERVEDISPVKSMQQLVTLLFEESRSFELNPADKLYLRSFMQLVVKPNLEYNERITEENKARAALNVEPIYYPLKKGQVIAREGDIIDEVTLAKINGLRSESNKLNVYLRLLGLLIMLVCYLIAMRVYAGFFIQRYYKVKNLFLLFNSVLLAEVLILKVTLLVSESMVGHFLISPLNNIQSYYYLIPYAVGGVLMTLLVNHQIAIILSIVASSFAGIITDGNFFVSLYALVSSFAGIYGIRHYRERSAILKASLIIAIFNVIMISAINLFQAQDQIAVFLFDVFSAFIGALLVAIFVSFLIPLFEMLFGIATDVKLLELSSMDRELLRRLSLGIPGTYQHSVMMGVLAEAAAVEIGANALFCRVAALYHDVGKLLTPEYFVENNPQAVKKHSKQTPHMSALILVNHVKKGIEIAREHKVPESIVAIIPQHHGTRLIGTFYQQAKAQEDPDIQEVKEEDFRYPGPKPQTKEAAIIMIADSIEAASRTINNPTPPKIRGMVEEIVNNIFIDNQIDECQLTLIDLRKITEAFIRKLVSIYHHRVDYPQFKFSGQNQKGGKSARHGE